MRTFGSPDILEYRRRLAVARLVEGYSLDEVADFLAVHPSSVRRWWAMFQEQGPTGLVAQPVSGRPCKLTRAQEKIVWRWLADSPTEHGFATELWTGERLAALIAEEFDVHFHPRSLQRWLRGRGWTLQKPQRVPRERDPEVIAAWLATEWPRIKKKRGGNTPAWC